MGVELVIKFPVWIISLTSQGISVPMIWLMIQNLFESVWEISKPQTLIDSGMSVFSWFPLDMGRCQTSLNMVAKLVNVISVDAMIPVEINFQINMITAEQTPVEEGGHLLPPDEVYHTLMGYLDGFGASGNFAESLGLLEFSGEVKGYAGVASAIRLLYQTQISSAC